MTENTWSIYDGPEKIIQHGYDATLWRWRLRQRNGLGTDFVVKVSGTAMATSPEHLPDATRRVRETQGRSEVEKLLDAR